jgi:hypothetical protein
MPARRRACASFHQRRWMPATRTVPVGRNTAAGAPDKPAMPDKPEAGPAVDEAAQGEQKAAGEHWPAPEAQRSSTAVNRNCCRNGRYHYSCRHTESKTRSSLLLTHPVRGMHIGAQYNHPSGTKSTALHPRVEEPANELPLQAGELINRQDADNRR